MKTKHLRLMQRVYIVLFFCFMYLPIAYMIVFSFNQSKGYSLFTGFTLKWYSSLLHNSSILHALLVSLEVALISAVIATVLGTAASLGIASMGRGSRLVVTNITYIPVVNPEIITGISLMLLFVAYQRFAGGVSWLPDTIMGFPTLLIAHIAFNVPYVIFNVTPKLKQLDIRLYEAALDLGCDPKQAFFKVILPEISPAILSAFLILSRHGSVILHDLTAQSARLKSCNLHKINCSLCVAVSLYDSACNCLKWEHMSRPSEVIRLCILIHKFSGCVASLLG